jgi:hypothetical protein
MGPSRMSAWRPHSGNLVSRIEPPLGAAQVDKSADSTRREPILEEALFINSKALFPLVRVMRNWIYMYCDRAMQHDFRSHRAESMERTQIVMPVITPRLDFHRPPQTPRPKLPYEPLGKMKPSQEPPKKPEHRCENFLPPLKIGADPTPREIGVRGPRNNPSLLIRTRRESVPRGKTLHPMLDSILQSKGLLVVR